MKGLSRGGVEIMLDVLGGMDSSDAILAQESREQQRMVASTRLPREQNHLNPEKDAKSLYEKLGIKVLGEADDLFFNVELPTGWKLVPTDHSMWSKVLDEKGRDRLSIFYKGAFYDRSAFVNLCTRFCYSAEGTYEVTNSDGTTRRLPFEERMKLPQWGVVKMDQKEVWRTKTKAIKHEGSIHDYDKIKTELQAECKAWLDKNYPKWEDQKEMWEY